jgi:hypothetical protein
MSQHPKRQFFLKWRVSKENIWTTRNEVTGDWRKIHNVLFHDLYISQNIIKIIKFCRLVVGRTCRKYGREAIEKCILSLELET